MFLLAQANHELTLAAQSGAAQYHLFLAAMLFGNIRNPGMAEPFS